MCNRPFDGVWRGQGSPQEREDRETVPLATIQEIEDLAGSPTIGQMIDEIARMTEQDLMWLEGQGPAADDLEARAWAMAAKE